MSEDRSFIKDKKRIVVKIGSSSLIHPETGGIDYVRLEKLVRILSDLKNRGKEVVLVSSGAIGVGRKSLGLKEKPETLALKQACAAVGQGQLMMIYQKLFLEYNHKAAQVLLTFDVITSDERRKNAKNTLNELIGLGIIPVVNENDTVATDTGTDMVICNSNDLTNISRVVNGKDVGTLFISHEQDDFDAKDFIINKKYMD